MGGGGGILVSAARRRGWVAEGFAGPAVLGLAVCAYASAVALGGNGFISAFVGGLAFGTTAGRPGQSLVPFVEETGALASLLVWLAFGAIAVVPAMDVLTWQAVVYAVLSVTVVRMVPVTVALAGARLGRPTVALVAWFGPRGLASVVFALLALEELGGAANGAVSVITVTVLLSVVAHGATADPLATRYARYARPPRRTTRRRRSPTYRTAGLSDGRTPVRSAAAPTQAHPPKVRNPVAPEIASLASAATTASARSWSPSSCPRAGRSPSPSPPCW